MATTLPSRGLPALVVLATCVAGCDDERAASAGWPSLGFDFANSRHNGDESVLDRDNVAGLVQRWRVDGLGNGVTGTPVVRDGVVYVGDWAGNMHARRVADGSVVWQVAVARPESERDAAWTQINATAFVSADRVFVGDGLGVLHALDRKTGAEVWATSLDAHEDANIYASPVLVDDLVLIGVAAVENNADKADYTFRGSVVAVDADDGAIRWRLSTSADDATSGAGVSVWSSVAVDRARGLAFVGTGQAFEAPAGPNSDAIMAIDYKRGVVAWVHQVTVDDVFTRPDLGPGPDADVGTSPNLFSIDGRDVVGAGDKGGRYTVVDRVSGERVWQVQLGKGSLIGGIMVSAAVADGRLYVASNDWNTFLFALNGEHSPNDTSVTYALDLRDGREVWQSRRSAPSFGAIAVCNGVVYQTTIDGFVHALASDTGAELGRFDLGQDLGGGVSVVDGQVFVGAGFRFYSGASQSTGALVALGLP